ncbi:MAG: polyprenyl synthetase family protein [Nitrosopumilus sp.]|nr:polyprenyl synthetase family protein [Nitrosopumilus sp.]
MSSEEIKTEINFVASKINQFILNNISSEPFGLYTASLHYIKSGGKRLRPFMTVKSCELLNGNLLSSLPAAASVELIHNFTLVHDDIMDNDNVRHNVTTVHRQFGIPLAILAGDVLFSKAFQVISIHGKKIGIDQSILLRMVDLLSYSCIDVCEGQALDIQMAQDDEFSSTESYIKMIEKKTAALFRVSCELGTLSSPDFTEKDLRNMSSYGEKIGIAFQLIDDLIGIHGDSKITGKFVGNDIREGKKTLPVLLAFQNLGSTDRDLLKQLFGSKNAKDSEIAEMVKKIAQIRVDKQVRDIANTYTEAAFKTLQSYDRSPALISLENSAKYIVERSL